MLQALLYTLLGLVLGVFLLPVAIGLRLDRPRPENLLTLRLDWTFFAGLAGLCLHFQAARWRLYPLVLGCRLKFFHLQLHPKKTPRPERAKVSPRPPAEPERANASPRPPAGPERQARSSEAGPRPGKPKASVSAFDRLVRLVDLLYGPGRGFLRYLPRTIKLYRLRLNGCFGFHNPAETGFVHGYLEGLSIFNSKILEIDLKPDFTRPGLNGRLCLVIHLHLGLLLALALIFATRVGCRWLAARLTWLPRKPGFA